MVVTVFVFNSCTYLLHLSTHPFPKLRHSCDGLRNTDNNLCECAPCIHIHKTGNSKCVQYVTIIDIQIKVKLFQNARLKFYRQRQTRKMYIRTRFPKLMINANTFISARIAAEICHALSGTLYTVPKLLWRETFMLENSTIGVYT